MSINSLAAYLPVDRFLALAHGDELEKSTNGTVLFADVSGFTPLTESLTQALGEQRGAEELTILLNRVFDALVSEVDRYGGSVLGFAGDAMTVWFGEGQPEKLAAPAVTRAAACAFVMQKAMAQFTDIVISDHKLSELAIKISLASGPVNRFLVGDPSIKLFDILTGKPVFRMADGDKLSKRGEVIADEISVSLLGDSVEVKDWRKSGNEVRFAVLGDKFIQASDSPWSITEQDILSKKALIPWLSEAVYDRLDADSSEFFIELRPVTALFLRFSGIDFEEDPHAEEKLNALLRPMLQTCARYESTPVLLSIGDKGCYFSAAFGAPLAHEDDIFRAVACASDLRDLIKAEIEFLEPVQIGISQGIMRTGSYGGKTARAYSCFGDQMNLAARLMQFARPGEVIVHQVIQQATTKFFEWDQLPLAQVKGKTKPVPIARLGSPIRRTRLQRAAPKLVGRKKEVALLQDLLHTTKQGTRSLLTIEGDAGIGKTRLASELLRLAESLGMYSLVGSGQAIEGSTPYRAWRDIFYTFFSIDPSGDRSQNSQQVLSQCRQELGKYSGQLGFIALLNDLLNLNLTEDEALTVLDAHQRQQALLELMAALLTARAERQPVLIVLEDAQWLDSLSWQIVLRLFGVEAKVPLLLALFTRPLADRKPLESFDAIPGVCRLVLKPLGGDECTVLAASALGLSPASLPAPLIDLIQLRSQGNPFFAEQIVLALRDQGLLTITLDEDSGVSVDWHFETTSPPIPPTLQGLLLARIDRLPLERQLILKSAAVIGSLFTFRPLLHVLHSYASSQKLTLEDDLTSLDQQDLIALEALKPELAYLFENIMIQDIAYQTLSHAQKQHIHRELALWYESIYSSNLASVYAPLSYHWEGAEVEDKAIYYLLQAGDSARALYALPEALSFYKRALKFLRSRKNDDLTARTLMKLGLTHHLAFDYRLAREAYDEGFVFWQAAARAPLARPPARGSLAVDWVYMPLTLDPSMTDDMDTIGVVDQLFSGLVSLGAGMEVEPCMAQRWDISEDGLTYRFSLLPEARWSDGAPLTAADFEYAWKRLLEPVSHSLVASLLYDIKNARAYHLGTDAALSADSIGVRALDATTLEVVLEQPTGYFLYVLTNNAACPVPRHIVERLGTAWSEPISLVTNGPFRLIHWEQKNDHEGEITLARNLDYPAASQGNLEQVILRTLPDEAQRLAAYEAGELDILSFRNLSDEREQVRQRHPAEYLSAPLCGVTYIGLNTSHAPLDDPMVRQALAQALDKEWFADVDRKGFAFPASGGFLPPGIPGHIPNIGQIFHPEFARMLLTEAGFKGGVGLPVLELLAGPDQESIVDFIAHNWLEHLGISVHSQILEWDALLDRLEKDLPDVFINIWIDDYPDPDNLLRASTALRWSPWKNTEYQSLVESARGLYDQPKRLDLYRRADRILVDEAAFIPLSYWRSHLLLKPAIKRFPTSSTKWWYWKDVIQDEE